VLFSTVTEPPLTASTAREQPTEMPPPPGAARKLEPLSLRWLLELCQAHTRPLWPLRGVHRELRVRELLELALALASQTSPPLCSTAREALAPLAGLGDTSISPVMPLLLLLPEEKTRALSVPEKKG
jgi:hypothetical protein